MKPAPRLSAAGPIQGTACVRADVRPAVVRPGGGLRLGKDPGTLLPQQRARLLLLLQVQLSATGNVSTLQKQGRGRRGEKLPALI